MSEASSSPSRVDLDKARDSIRVVGAPPPTDIASEQQRPDGTVWDKPAPTRPPGDKGIQFPEHLDGVVNFFQEIILSESFLLELCFDRMIDMVESGVKRRIVGTDNWAGDGEGQAGGPFTPTHYAGIAGPLTIELYKQVLIAIEGKEDEYKKVLAQSQEKLKALREEATRVRHKSPVSASGIILP